jgi:hypothetical protein
MDAGLCCEIGFHLEGDDYKTPENEIVVDIEVRELTPHITESSTSPTPAYLNTCYDEFSREFCSYSIADSSLNNVSLVSYEDTMKNDTILFPDEKKESNQKSNDKLNRHIFLQHYHPYYPRWSSTFKHSPLDTRHMLATGPRIINTDNHILFEINPIYGTKAEFEPIFGSMILYTFINDACVRLSESFHFDCTARNIKNKFRDVYNSEDIDKNNPSEFFIPTNLSLFTIPEEFHNKDVFVVIQLTKVLTGERISCICMYPST